MEHERIEEILDNKFCYKILDCAITEIHAKTCSQPSLDIGTYCKKRDSCIIAVMAQYVVRGDVGILCINNPPVNALSIRTSEAMLKCIEASMKDHTVGLVLCGTGKQFSAGADITEFETSNEGRLTALIDVTNALEASTKPVVAALHGYALGGGLELALASHYRIAESGAKFGLPEVKLGILPAAGGTQRLPRLIGLDMAMEWISSGKVYSAEHAARVGILDQIVPDGSDIVDAAVRFVKEAAKQSLTERRLSSLVVKDRHQVEEITAKHLSLLHKKSRGQISPIACIQAVRFSAIAEFSEGMKKEAELFKTLVTSGQASGLMHSFFAERQIRNWSVPSNTSINWATSNAIQVKKGAVIGLGTMGRGIAINFLQAGIPIFAMEHDELLLASGLKNVHAIIDSMAKHKVITANQQEKMRRSIQGTMSYSDLKNVDLVIEAVIEEIEAKKNVFQSLDQACKTSAILASNTSALDIDEIASFTRRPDKVMGMHFFAPADRMILLENVYGAKTSGETIATCMSMGKIMKKVTVLVGNCYGFVANRMYVNYMVESDFLLEEGCYPQIVDRAITDYGFAMGRYLVGDLSGNDVLYRVRHAAGLTVDQQPQGAPIRHRNGKRYCPLSDYLYAKGRYGFKTGKGWYDYEQGSTVPKSSPEVVEMIDNYRMEVGVKPRRIDHEEILERMLYPLINEGFKCLDEGYASSPLDIDMVWIHGYTWPKHTGGPMFYAQTVGLPRLLEVIEKFHNKYGDGAPHWQPSEMLIRIVRECGNPPMEEWMRYARGHISLLQSRL